MNVITKPKGAPYTRRETKALEKISPGFNQKAKLDAFCIKFRREYALAYAKWHTMHLKPSPAKTATVNPAQTAIKPVKFTSPAKIEPFALVDGLPVGTRGFRASTQAMISKLDPLVDMLEPGRYSVTIPKENNNFVRSWLTKTKQKSGKVFSIGKIAGNSKVRGIFRRF